MSQTTYVTSVSRRQRRKNLGRLLRPRHIAFIGGTQAARALAACRRAGFKGQLWTVNPRRDEIGGIPCVSRIEDLPEAPDAALLGLSPRRSIEAVSSLSAMGAGGAVCIAAGFAELGNEAGEALQTALKEAAGDLALLGPNCMGVLNQFDGAAVWGSDNHMESAGETGAAIISQSGAFVYGITNVEQAFPLGYGISIGNQAVTDAADCIEAVLDDDRIKAIGIYLEGLEDGNALGAACSRALEKGVPVVALKGGDTAAGATVAVSHTGAMVVERDMWQAFAERYGIVEVSSPKAMVETLKLLTIGGVPRGRRLSVVTFSGGLNGLVAARAPQLGLELTQPTAENASRLRAKMPETVPIANPLDLNIPWRSKTMISMEDGDSVADGIVDLARDVADMIVFFADVPRRDEKGLNEEWYASIEGMGHVRKTLGLPCAVAGILPEGLDVGLRKRLLAAGVAPLLGFSDAMEAFSVAARLADVYARKKRVDAPLPLFIGNGNTSIADTGQMLDEAKSKELLRPFGLKTAESWSGAGTDAAAAAEKLGFPVALKVLSNTIAHKAELGGVHLGLASANEVEKAVAQIAQAIAAAPEGHKVERFLVERMIDYPINEFIIGIKRHPALGFALMIGRGGSAVELLRHYATLLLPLENTALKIALNRIGMTPNTIGYAALQEAVCAVAAFAEANRDHLVALDVNPVIVTGKGEAIAADALVVMAG